MGLQAILNDIDRLETIHADWQKTRPVLGGLLGSSDAHKIAKRLLDNKTAEIERHIHDLCQLEDDRQCAVAGRNYDIFRKERGQYEGTPEYFSWLREKVKSLAFMHEADETNPDNRS